MSGCLSVLMFRGIMQIKGNEWNYTSTPPIRLNGVMPN